MMNRFIFYVLVYLISIIVSFIAVGLVLAIIILILMFVTWSLPVASPFTWVVFRILFSMAVIVSTIFMFSPNAKQWVDQCCKDYEDGE